MTVDDLRTKPWLGADADVVFSRLAAMYGAAHALARSGLEFVGAPVAAGDGAVVHRLDSAFSIAVLPLLHGRHNRFGEYASDGDRDDVLRILARLHAAPSTFELLTDDYAVSARDVLDQALDDLATPWTWGPFSDATRRVLIEGSPFLQHALAAYDDFARGVRAAAPRTVITHGEPHAANVIFGSQGPMLFDWDTLKLGPIERDLARVVGADADDAAAYITAGGDAPDPDRLLMYTLWWDLNDVALYVDMFRRPHAATADTEQMLRGLRHAAQLGERFPGLLD